MAHRQTGNSSFQLVITLALSWEGGPVPTALSEVQDAVHGACQHAQGCVLATLIGQNVLLTVVSSVRACGLHRLERSRRSPSFSPTHTPPSLALC